MSPDRLAAYLGSLPDAELADAVRRATVELLLLPPGPDRDRLECHGAYAAGWFAAVETGREALWLHAVAAGREEVRGNDRENWRRAKAT